MMQNNYCAPKVLLLTHGNPDSNGVGEIFLKEIARFYPSDMLIRYSLVDKYVLDTGKNWLGFKSIVRYAKFSALPGLSSWRQLSFICLSSKKIIAEIESIIKKYRINIIWAILNSGYIIHIVKSLMDHVITPFVFTVWDTPEYFANNQYLDKITRDRMYKTYSLILKKGRQVSVVSEGMREIFKSKYGINSIVMRHGIHPSYWNDSSQKSDPKDEYIVGFAGSLYSKKEWNSFINCILDIRENKNYKIKIKFIGRFPRFGAKKESFIDFAGILPFEDTLLSLSKVDVAYVPYWFDQKYSYFVKTAFPSKISTYSAIGVPILYHGPIESTPSYFINKYRIGLCCHTSDIIEIQEILLKLLFDNNLRIKIKSEQKKALEEELGLEIMLTRFALLLGIERNMLLPL